MEKRLGNKIIVLGCPGSGKSTFSIRLGEKTGLPVVHLDNIWWRADQTHITREAFNSALEEVLQGEKWIIDGNYHRTYEMRIRACDTVFFLDYSVETCMDGILTRIGKKRQDIPWTESEPDPQLMDFVRNYRSTDRPQLIKLLEAYAEKQLIVFTDRQQAEEWFHTL